MYWIEAENEELAVATVHSHLIQVDRVYELLLLSTDIPKNDNDEGAPSFSAYRMKKSFIISETMFVTFANHSIRLFRTQKPQRTRSLNETNFPFDFTECTTSHTFPRRLLSSITHNEAPWTDGTECDAEYIKHALKS